MTSARPPRFSVEENRSRILDKANELFRQYGFGKTTVADIARELGMSPANIYKFFPSKDAIVEASANRNLAAIRRDVTEIAERPEPVAVRIEAICLLIFHFHQDLFRNEQQIFKMVTQAIEEAWDCVDDYHEFLSTITKQLLREAIEAGEFRAGDIDHLAQALLDALFLALHPHFRHSWTPDEDSDRVHAHIELVLSALRCAPPLP